MKWSLMLLVLCVGCNQSPADRQQQMESDLKEIDRLQQDRFRHEAKSQAAEDDMQMREAINKAKAKYK